MEENENKEELKEEVVEEINEEENALKQELEDVTDRYKRILAEFENFKKRSSKEREGLYNSLTADIASKLLPVMDNLEKASQAETQDTNYKQGIELVIKQFKDVLTSIGVKEIEAVGKTFDPSVHEAVSSVVDETLGVQEVKEEFRKGYMIGSKVIRHSMVVVAN